MRRLARFLFVAAVAVAALVAADFAWTRIPSRLRILRAGSPVEYRYAAIDALAAHIARLEKPDAHTALLLGPGCGAVARSLAAAGMACTTNRADGRFGLVFAVGAKADWRLLSGRALPGAAAAWLFGVRDMKAQTLRAMMEAFPCPDAHLWMVGEDDWLLTGRMEPCRVKLDVMLELFASDDAMEDLAAASCGSLPELFACYAGSRADVMPAFDAGDVSAAVRPEFFLTKEIPAITWVDRGGADEDIYEGVMREIRSMQVVRRVVVEGNMLARAGKAEEAVDKWAAAILRNPHDSMLLDRLYRLAVNASAFEKVGNLPGAAKCYETMVSVRPTDAAALERYAQCMKRLGRADVASAAERRAAELRRLAAPEG